MILEEGEKVHVIERRLLEDDASRHFIGEVERCTDRAVRVRGFVFVYDASSREFVRRGEPRVRVIALDNHVIINVIPREANLRTMSYMESPKMGLTVTDGQDFSLVLNEFGPRR